jgi:hypothetical protein
MQMTAPADSPSAPAAFCTEERMPTEEAPKANLFSEYCALRVIIENMLAVIETMAPGFMEDTRRGCVAMQTVRADMLRLDEEGIHVTRPEAAKRAAAIIAELQVVLRPRLN